MGQDLAGDVVEIGLEQHDRLPLGVGLGQGLTHDHLGAIGKPVDVV